MRKFTIRLIAFKDLILLSKGRKIILAVNDLMTDYRASKCYMTEVEDQLELLRRFGVNIERVIRYSQYVSHATLYLARLVQTKMRYVMCEEDDIYSDIFEIVIKNNDVDIIQY